ncbi:hypothetical protein NL676_019527 [Syzygium grande]|nr:hypothetical protein NL676_019527 [Syzygium grande]
MVTDRRTHSGNDPEPRYGCQTCIKTGPKNQSSERIIRFDHHFASLEEDHPTADGFGDGLIIIVKWFWVRRVTNAHEAGVLHQGPPPTEPLVGRSLRT